MSPLNVRRFRAERLLRGQFEALRAGVVTSARARLRGIGVTLDKDDLESCYASAWQGLYMAVLDGQEIDNPAAWLALVTFRRAVDEHRARSRRAPGGGDLGPLDLDVSHGRAKLAAHEPDLAGEIDDRTKLRQLFEGLRGRLGAREREAAVLCYLQGLSRAQAAERMGVSEARMRKLMEGAGTGRPGVAGKVGALVETIRDGGWCEEQGSLMRAFAYGVLDPDGERYQLALLHRGDCPSCRAYVTSLRGLAATLPPVFLPWGLGAAALAQVSGGGVSVGALSASGAAGAGAGASGLAGGGWLFAGATKLAAGCVLALSVGAGCVALEEGSHDRRAPAHRRHTAHALDAAARTAAVGTRAADGQSGADGARSGTAKLTPAGKASREFGPERASSASARIAAGSEHPLATSARVSAGTAAKASTSRTSTVRTAAEREFSPG
ncbi:MAG TPA: sigma-70 family RNA polymerase sigma factor [Solirubrobacteraceae bacterium]|nr:sigma-70 family RNA polymerase sigma factor [Solirubrobacteraceae bacterium]